MSILPRCCGGKFTSLRDKRRKTNAKQFPSEIVVSITGTEHVVVAVRSYVLLDGGPWGITPFAILVAIKLQHTRMFDCKFNAAIKLGSGIKICSKICYFWNENLVLF